MLPASDNTSRRMRLPNSGGISPVSVLPASDNTSRRMRLLNSGRISPVSSLFCSHSSRRFSRSPSATGISSESWFPFKLNSRRSVSWPRTAGMLPLRPRYFRFNTCTRPGRPRTVTPSHLAIGVSASQFSATLPAKTSRASSNTAQSLKRPGLRSGSGTAMPLKHNSCGVLAPPKEVVGDDSQVGSPSSSRSFSLGAQQAGRYAASQPITR